MNKVVWKRVAFAITLFGVMSCGSAQCFPAKTEADIGKVLGCLTDQMQKGVTDPTVAVMVCLPSDIPLAEDLWKSLVGAKSIGEKAGAARVGTNCAGSK